MNQIYLELIEHGYKILPVEKGGKKPMTPHGVKDATNDREQVERWAREYPGCNWGIACSNVIVFDLDKVEKRGGQVVRVLTDAELMEHWHYLRETYGLPEAPEVVTGSGGRHYYFKRPYAEIKARTKFKYQRNGEQVESNIDIRVGDIYVVAPGSVNADGNPYQSACLWAVDELNELPAEFVEILPKKNEQTAAPVRVTDWPTEYRGADVVGRCRRYVEQMEPAVQGQGGHGQLLNAACVIFWDFGLEQVEGWPIYLDYCDRCEPPFLDNKEIEHKYYEAFKVGAENGKPRGWRNNRKPDTSAIGRAVNAPPATDGQTDREGGKRADGPKFLIRPDEDFSDDIFDGFGKDAKIIETGLPELDEFLDGGLSGLTILGGVPAVGKSSFALQIADYNAANGKRVLIVSLEMSRAQLVAKTLSRISAGVVCGRADGGLLEYLTTEETENRQIGNKLGKCLTVREIMRTKEGAWDKGKLEIYQQSKSFYSDYIKSYRYIMQRERGELRLIASRDLIASLEWYQQQTGFAPDMIVTDYLQLFDETSETGRDLTDKQQADQTVSNLKLISEEIPVVAVASFNRAAYYKPASRESFKESGGLEYTAELLLALQPSVEWWGTEDETKQLIDEWKEKNPRPIDLVILKDRFGADGKTFNFGMLPTSGGFYYEGERKPKQRRNFRAGRTLLVSVEADISEVLRETAGFDMSINELTGKLRNGYSMEDVRRAINRPKSLLRHYNDATGEERVRLVTEKEQAGNDTAQDAPRELDEQDYLESID